MFVTYRQHPCFDLSFTASRTDMRSARAIGQIAIAGLPACQPLVADVGADAEPPAQLPSVYTFLHCKADKTRVAHPSPTPLAMAARTSKRDVSLISRAVRKSSATS